MTALLSMKLRSNMVPYGSSTNMFKRPSMIFVLSSNTIFQQSSFSISGLFLKKDNLAYIEKIKMSCCLYYLSTYHSFHLWHVYFHRKIQEPMQILLLFLCLQEIGEERNQNNLCEWSFGQKTFCLKLGRS